MIPVLTPTQSAEWDRLTTESGLPLAALMESAGRGVASVVTARYAGACRQGTLVAAGPGNNGGDGWVVARALHAIGLPVWVVPLPGRSSELNRLQASLAARDGVRTVPPDGPWPGVGLVIDAILGTGAKGPLREPVRALVARLAELALPVVAVDGPTGLDLGDGVSDGPVRADLTVTFGGYRRGHLLARDEVGDLCVIDIGFGPPSTEWPALFALRDAARILPELPARAHKGVRGRVVVVGGDQGMVGAARIAARAAFAAGAGLVHVVAPAESVRALNAAEPDVQTAVAPFDAPLADPVRELLARADAVVVGPGLGRGPGRGRLITEIRSATAAPLVLDADGLIAFAGQVDRLRALGGALVLTPHAGEFRALFPDRAADLAVDPWARALDAAVASDAVVLLKGVPTVVAQAARAPVTVAAGNPGLATGGSGDALSGIIGAFLARGVELRLAAAAAAQALGDAADVAARRTAARTVRPMDVIAALADVWRSWELGRRSGPAPFAPVLHELPAPLRI
jgi:ADP-dependent NAD(P)H-hydrate dehydratase / NAD(P)H-hydrate epimerase